MNSNLISGLYWTLVIGKKTRKINIDRQERDRQTDKDSEIEKKRARNGTRKNLIHLPPPPLPHHHNSESEMWKLVTGTIKELLV